MGLSLARFVVLNVLIASASLWAFSGTNGTPLGGMGAGYVVFNAKDGNFAAVTKVSPAASVTANEFNSYKSNSCGFHLYANGASKQKATTTLENAEIPIYAADFGTVGGVRFTDTAFGPFISGAAWEQLAHSPLAFFDVTAQNNNATACDVAVALEFSNTTGTNNLLGGANTGTADGGNAITWAGDSTAGNGYLMVNCDGAAPTYYAGAMGNFLTDGTLATGAGNIVSAKCTSVPAGGIVHFRFVMAWWSIWKYSGTSTTKPGTEGRWYQNFYSNSKQAALYGMSMYDKAKTGAISIVTRTMASNFPAWYKDRLLCNLYPLSHNTVAAQDGRTGVWEGQYAIIGTIDQSEHAGVWFVWNWPNNQWRELQYWARQSRQEPTLLGQIHHDFNGTTNTSSWTYGNGDINHFLYPWDNYTHADYQYQSNTSDWSDLNSMFVYKAYELMMATGQKDSLLIYWPAIKRAANRIIVESGTTSLPTTAKCTYDDGQADPSYCCGEALSTWLAIIEMAKWLGEDSTVAKYTAQYNAGRAQYATSYASANTYCTGSNKSVSDPAGYDWGRYLNLPAIFDSNYAVKACSSGYRYASTQSGISRLGKWHFYGYDHLGGLMIASGRQDTAMTLHNWDYNQFYTVSAATCVFWQDLWGTSTSHYSYCTAPNVWRSYFQFTGTMLDRANNRLWIRPMVPSSMNKTIVNAPLITPKGWGTLNYDENVSGTRVQNIVVSFDSATAIKEIVLKNNTQSTAPGTALTSSVLVRNNGTTVAGTAMTEGTGFEKIIRIAFSAPITVQSNLTIQLFNGAAGVGSMRLMAPQEVLSLTAGTIGRDHLIYYSVPASGMAVMELFSLNGAKLGTIMKGMVEAGKHSFTWNGKFAQGKSIYSGMAVLRLSSKAGSVSKTVRISK